MKIYLSGPMKGYPQSNYPLFNRVAAELRIAGHDVYNPAEFPHDGPFETFPLRRAFAVYCRFICEEADAIVLLPGWEKSLGVSAELALAKNCKVEVIEWSQHPSNTDNSTVALKFHPERIEAIAKALYLKDRGVPGDAWDRDLPDSTLELWRDYARTALAADTTGTGDIRGKLKPCPEEAKEHLCAFPSCSCAADRLPYNRHRLSEHQQCQMIAEASIWQRRALEAEDLAAELRRQLDDWREQFFVAADALSEYAREHDEKMEPGSVAPAGDTGTAETEGLGAKHEHAVGEAETPAQTPPSPPSATPEGDPQKAVKAFRTAALAAIQDLRHAAACNFSPAYSGALGEARCDSFFEAYEAIRKLAPSESPSTKEASE